MTMTARQALAYAHPVADPSRTPTDDFAEHHRIAGGVLITILTVNR